MFIAADMATQELADVNGAHNIRPDSNQYRSLD